MSDYETILDERGSTSDSDPGKTLIHRCFREYNRINQQSSYEHFDEYRVDDDDVYIFERTFKAPSNIFKDPDKDLSKILIKIFWRSFKDPSNILKDPDKDLSKILIKDLLKIL